MSCPDIMDLERYVQRELDDAARASTGEHLAACAECAQQVAELEENLRLAPALRRGVDAPPAVDDWFTHADAIPETVGPYRILRKLGQGGMGSVYEGVAKNSGRRVAMKLIAPQYAFSEEALERFRDRKSVV